MIVYFSYILVPETCSLMFRNIIESLFVTHAETKLNSKGNIVESQTQHGPYIPVANPWLNRGNKWHQGLLRRPHPMDE